MPIYEFYCRDCHTVYSFLARSTSPQEPKCPKCGRAKLERQMSRFAISKGLKESDSQDDPFANVDEDKMESVMMQMAGEFENANEDDPKAMAKMMRKLFDATGMEPSGTIQEAIRRMEAGEDPDKVEEEIGGDIDDSDPMALFSGGSMKKKIRRLIDPPNVDPNLYDL
ncbi:MAG: zinc ribbon domain-containing protein [Pirellulales bacterium]